MNTQHTAVWLYVEFPAAERFPGMFTLEAKERWKAGWWGSEQRSTLLTEQDFELDIGGRHRSGSPVYRKIYHATPENETLISLSGTLHYRPFPDLTLSPIELEIS
ncbi:hypothetical protein [Vreelandella stevensii]|uniref:hypothetical protein n=1 Tax=Vreelandella stevensii TaxID=502821 RepID=UPI00403B361A